MQLNPARGRKPLLEIYDVCAIHAGFMQLNPARGRKLVLVGSLQPSILL